MKANKKVMGNISTTNQNQRALNELATTSIGSNLMDLIRTIIKEEEAELIKQGLYMRAKDGYVISRVPYGYKISANKRLEVDYEVAGVVKFIFHKYVDGYGSTSIARLLKDSGIETPREHYKNTENPTNKWNGATILRILKNKVYTGVYRYGTYRRIGEILEIEYNHEPIISEEVFIEVQRILDMRKGKLGG